VALAFLAAGHGIPPDFRATAPLPDPAPPPQRQIPDNSRRRYLHPPLPQRYHLPMRPPPPMTKIASYPIVGGIGILAIAVSLAYWSKQVDVSPLFADAHVRQGQVWRLFTDIFPHGALIHLTFN